MSDGLSELTQNVASNGIGSNAGTPDNVILLIGAATSGTPDTVYQYDAGGDVAIVKSDLTSGPLAEAIAYEQQFGQVLAVPVASDVPATIGTVTPPSSGSPPALTPSGTPVDNYDVRVQIVAGGAIGTSTFQYSLNGGAKYLPDSPVATSATYAIPGTGLTLGFATGTYVAGHTYAFTATAPGYTAAKLQAAFAAYLAGTDRASLLHVVGTPADSAAFATLVTAIQTLLAASTSQHCYMRAFADVPDTTDTLLQAAMASIDADRVSGTAGDVDITSPLTGQVTKRPGSWAEAARAVSVEVHRHLGAVADKGLAGVSKIYRDERSITPGLNKYRFCTLRTRPQKNGLFYIEQDHSFAAKPSDFDSIHAGRVMDKACTICAQEMQDYINGDWEASETGTLSDATIASIESEVLDALIQGLYPKKSVSAVKFVVDPHELTLKTSIIRCKVAIQPKAYSKWIINNLSFVVSLPTG